MFTGKGLDPQQTEALTFVRTLLNYRKNSLAIQQGKLQHFVPQDGIYVQSRHQGNETLLVIYNKNTLAVELDLQRFKPAINDNTIGVDIISKQSYSLSKPLSLANKGVTILKLER